MSRSGAALPLGMEIEHSLSARSELARYTESGILKIATLFLSTRRPFSGVIKSPRRKHRDYFEPDLAGKGYTFEETNLLADISELFHAPRKTRMCNKSTSIGEIDTPERITDWEIDFAQIKEPLRPDQSAAHAISHEIALAAGPKSECPHTFYSIIVNNHGRHRYRNASLRRTHLNRH